MPSGFSTGGVRGRTSCSQFRTMKVRSTQTWSMFRVSAFGIVVMALVKPAGYLERQRTSVMRS